MVNELASSRVSAVSVLPKMAKALKRNARRQRYRARLRSGDVDLVALDELAVWTRDWIDSFPEHYDLVVGVPRSGMLVASIIACKLGCPLTTPRLYRENHWWSSRLLPSLAPDAVRSILLVDDSIDRGTSMANAKALVETVPGDTRITTAALIAQRKEAVEMVDLHHRFLEHPTLFEWNLMHAKPMTYLSVSLEGILDKPGRRPAYEIDLIIAQGSKGDRAQKEAWLHERGIRYRELALLGAQTKSELLASKCPDMHFEASVAEAKVVWESTKIPTLSFDAMELIGSLR
jgi:adenine/guanine phosphoribosyltransferase-like PRPP-binding protein